MFASFWRVDSKHASNTYALIDRVGFIAAMKAEHSIQLMCRVLGVSRSGFHAW